MLTCKGASRLICEHQERPLNFRERWGLRLHLWICRNCRRFERQIKLLRQAVREIARRTDAAEDVQDLPDDVKARIRKALEKRPK